MTRRRPSRPRQRSRRPFCGDAAAARAFDGWVGRLESQGVELNDADRLLVGLVASRQANLEALRRAIGRAGIDRRLALEIAEDRAARAFGAAMDRAERVFGPRIVDEAAVSLPAAVGEGPRGRLALVPRRVGAVEARILATLEGGVRLSKTELRARVAGGQSEFLRALRELVADGRVVREGLGRRNHPKRYRLEED